MGGRESPVEAKAAAAAFAASSRTAVRRSIVHTVNVREPDTSCLPMNSAGKT
jgi:hypothetical protein